MDKPELFHNDAPTAALLLRMAHSVQQPADPFPFDINFIFIAQEKLNKDEQKMEKHFSQVVLCSDLKLQGSDSFSPFCPLECTKLYTIEFSLTAKEVPLDAVVSFEVQPVKFKLKHPVLQDEPLIVCTQLPSGQDGGKIIVRQRLDLPCHAGVVDKFETEYKSVNKYQVSDASGHLKTRNIALCKNVAVSVTLKGSAVPLSTRLELGFYIIRSSKAHSKAKAKQKASNYLREKLSPAAKKGVLAAFKMVPFAGTSSVLVILYCFLLCLCYHIAPCNILLTCTPQGSW